jgi:hypothetical protein
VRSCVCRGCGAGPSPPLPLHGAGVANRQWRQPEPVFVLCLVILAPLEPLAPPRHCDGPPAVPTAGWLRPTAHCTHSGLMILLAQQNPSPAPVNPFGRSDTTSHHYPSVSFFHTAASAPPTDSCSAGLQRSFRCTAAVRAGRRCVSVHQCSRHRRRPALPLYFSRSRIYLVPLPSFPQVEVPELGPHPGLIPPPRSSWSEQTTYSLNTAVVFVHSLLTLRV